MHFPDTDREAVFLCFRDGVSLQPDGKDGPLLLIPPAPPILLAGAPPIVVAALGRLCGEGSTEQQIVDAVAEGGSMDTAILMFLLRQLERLNLLAFAVRDGAAPVAALHPISSWFAPARSEIQGDCPYVLSRFAYLHRAGDRMLLESPRSHALLKLQDPRAAAFCHALCRPSTLLALALASGMAVLVVRALLRLLLGARLALPADEQGRTEEEQAPQLAPWSFHDLLFHARSRAGRHAEVRGKTYPFRNSLPPLPAVRPPPAGAVAQIALQRPDLREVLAADPPFTAVLEARRSARAQGREPISIEALGELLYRAARVRSRRAGDHPYETTSRPYPSGGACYELDIYLAVQQCRGLPAGLYHYDPEAHGLCRLRDLTPDVLALLDGAARATLSQARPQILLCIASRFQRVSWSYEGIAYSVVLKDVGVLYQTIYLVAEAMGLSCCAVGSGDSDLFARAAGTDYYAETTVGEMILGSRVAEE
ncbi:SagB family peptide dehydrogenase [Sorangium sp. So ce1335]|uniref:SagB family peptide dehydrogenase n=1 Tax=Sorangium sp. So ce1335 TaxID=3133335 RepID=UPI003F631FD2